MLKKFLIIVLLFIVAIPGAVHASGQSGHYYPPSDSDYFMKKFTWQIYVSKGVKKINFTQYDMKKRKRFVLYYDDPPQNSFFWIDFTCRGQVNIQFLDNNGQVLHTFDRGPATQYLDNSACKYKSFASHSDYNEKKKKYKSDKFKRK